MLTSPYSNPSPLIKRDTYDDIMLRIDYTNLYIKNLDRDVTSRTLFELFTKFGKIVSARVMKDTQTGISRGYGFVSFRQIENSQEAQRQMNGFHLYTKPISVSFHEHKKTQQKIQIPSVKQDLSMYSPTCYFQPENKPWQDNIWLQPQQKTCTPSVVPQISTIQDQKLREIIDSHLNDHQRKDLSVFVDLIQFLDKSELSRCLFNPSLLKQYIHKAHKLIHLFKQHQPSRSVTTTPSLEHRQLDHPDIPALLSSLEGMSSNKKKRVLGDILFPLVKATGIRHAPKVTIHLLDTIALSQLASFMYNKSELSKWAHQAHIDLHGQNSTPFRTQQA